MFERSKRGATLAAETAHGERLSARCEGLVRDADPDPLPVAVDAVAAGRCASLRVAGVRPALRSLDGTEAAPSLADGRTVANGDHLLRLDGDPGGVVRFAGPATVRPTDAGVAVSFPRRTAVTLGVCARRPDRFPTVTVPATPTGVATAVTSAAAAHRTIGPERSLPTLRRAPPPVAVGNRDVPDAVAEAVPDTGIEIQVPRSMPDAFTVAPLAYYLGATVHARDGDARLVAPSVGLDRSLSPLPEVASAMLHRVFALDCLARAPAHPGLTEASALDALGLDAATLRRATPAERLVAYLDAPFERVADAVPGWHLATYVAPTREHVSCLAPLLDRLSLVYGPETEDLAGHELVKRSLDDFYRGSSGVEVTKPVLRRGDLHGWLAPGTPIDVFHADPHAFENARDCRTGDGPLQVTVVLNDPAMAGEEDAAAEAYREGATDAAVDVSVRRRLSRRELADAVESGTDHLHYVGHCEDEGVQCRDGYLSLAEVSESQVETFFLNACGSFHEGRALVRAGSVAGAVTFRDVLDEQAATVGTAFARLLVRGFCIERALDLARRRIRMGKDYAVVGDGTHALGGTASDPVHARVSTGDDAFDVTVETDVGRRPGGAVAAPGSDRHLLRGNAVTRRVDRATLGDLLDRPGLPVVHDGEFSWGRAFARDR